MGGIMSRINCKVRYVWLVFAIAVACWSAGQTAWAQQVEALPSLQDQEAPAAADDPAEEAKDKFLRLTYDDDGELVSMDTAIVRYAPADPDAKELTVDLVGVIHIAEREYYEKLNKLLDEYDVVLYELVAPEGTEIPKGGGKPSFHPLRLMQDGMRDMLKLESQLAHIDYTREHFVHADMSPEQFADSMKNRGEDFITMFFKIMNRSMAQQAKNPNRTSDLSFLLALFDRNRSHVLKRMMAEQFQDLESMMDVFQGPDGSAIISDRNKVALEVLAKQIDAGKKRIAVFYGAGHMPDMQQRLETDFGLKRQSEQWLVAWDLKGERAKSPDATNESDETSTEDADATREREPAEVGQP